MEKRTKILLLNTYLDKAIEDVMRLFIEETKKAIIANPNPKLSPEQKEKRIKELIEVKERHTKRCCDDIEEIMKHYHFDQSWIVIAKFIATLHDLGRYMEGEYCDSFSNVKDFYSKLGSLKISEHATFADRTLFEFKGLDDFYKAFKLSDFERKMLDYVTRGAIAYHQKDTYRFPKEYTTRFNMLNDRTLIKYNAFELLFNENTKPLVIEKMKSFFAQIMRDVDKIDILYQNYTGEMPVLRDKVAFKTNYTTTVVDGKNKIRYINFVSLSEIAKLWNISEEAFIKANPKFNIETLNEVIAMGPIDEEKTKEESPLYDEELAKKIKPIMTISMPTKDIDPKCLTIPKDIQAMFYNEEMKNDGKLKELQDRLDWIIITGMVWRLGCFLTDVNFIDVINKADQIDLLGKIYSQFPDKFKPVVAPFFEHSKSVWIKKKLAVHDSSMYFEENKRR